MTVRRGVRAGQTKRLACNWLRAPLFFLRALRSSHLPSRTVPGGVWIMKCPFQHGNTSELTRAV
eukprot:11154504-Lingulodinium_polyedra.AAC.1